MSAVDAKGKDAQDLAIDATATERLDTNDIESTKAALGETARVLDHSAERALCRKFDFRLLPVLAVMCRRPFICHFDSHLLIFRAQICSMRLIKAIWEMLRPMASARVVTPHSYEESRMANTSKTWDLLAISTTKSSLSSSFLT